MSVANAPAASGRPAISGRAFRQLLRVEVLQAWRQPTALASGVGLPILLLVVFGKIPAFNRPISAGSPLTIFEVYVPVLIALSLTLIALVSLPVPVVADREQGWLRRLSTTPVTPFWLLAALVVVYLVLALVTMVVIVLGGALFLGARLPGNPGGFVLAALLVTTALFALGLLVAAVTPTQGWATVVGGVLFVPLMFLAGLWLPLQLMPATLRAIADYSPLAAGVVAMQSAMQGDFPSPRALVVLLAYAGIFGVAAVRFFRWE